MKKFLFFIASFALAAAMLLGGCSLFSKEGKNGLDGRDGQDGADITVQQLYEAAKTIAGNENMTLDEFLREYLSFDGSDVGVSLMENINKSLMSGVSILTRFKYTSRYSGTTYKVFTGSGAIISLDKDAGDALVVTNCHVIYDDTSDTVFCDDVRLYLYGQDVRDINYSISNNYAITNDEKYAINAEVIGASVTYDIALLKVSGSAVLKRSDARAAEFSENENVYVGQQVYTVGNPEGEGMGTTLGTVSKDSQSVSLSLSDKNSNDTLTYLVLRTDAAINHGNSGGALYGEDGKIIAIVNAKDDEADVDNMGYALPAHNVRRLVQRLYYNYLENGNRMQSGGGINKARLNITTALTDSYSVYDENNKVAQIYETVKVESVSGSPSSGLLRAGDVLKKITVCDTAGKELDSVVITRRYNISDILLSVKQGDTVKVTVERNNTETEVSLLFSLPSYFAYEK